MTLVTKILAAGVICCIADDEGRFKINLRHIRAEVFTHDQVSEEEVGEALKMLTKSDFIRRYTVEKLQYAVVSAWKEHQPVPPTRLRNSTFPVPPEQTTRKQRADNRQAAGRPHARPERKGREGSGRPTEPNGSSGLPPSLSLTTSDLSPAALVFGAWVESTGRARSALTDGRKDLINRWLKVYSLEDLMAAVRGWRKVPHNRGENDRGRAYNDLELLLRDAQHIERFRDAELGTVAAPAIPPASRQTAAVDARARALLGRTE